MAMRYKPQRTMGVQSAHQTKAPVVANYIGGIWEYRRPVIYRYLEKQYVDRFFEDGTIRLSSFKKFEKHTDEQRQDKNEGYGMVSNVNPQTGETMFAVMSKEPNGYVLCGSTRYSHDLKEAFNVDSGFVIHDPSSFGILISKAIKGFLKGIEGPCIYQRRIENNLPLNIGDLKRDENNNLNMNEVMAMPFQAAGNELFFAKGENHSQQEEYRIIWLTNEILEEHIDIQCPEAIEFCTRFESIEE